MGSVKEGPHLVLFPFLSHGHIIPYLYLARLLRRRSAAVTLCTTPGNSAACRDSLAGTDISVVELPFSQNIDGVPAGVENTQDLPSMEAFVAFARATKSMQESFEHVLETLLPPVSAVISDMFLGWTLQSAEKFRLPRYAFTGLGMFSYTMYEILGRERPHAATNSPDEPFPMPYFPAIKLTKSDFDPPFVEAEPSGPYVEFVVEQKIAEEMSRGVLMNTFYELEKEYNDCWNEKYRPKSLCVGPLCLAAPPPSEPPLKASYIQFLDEKLERRDPVLYVAFGTQAEVSPEQIEEIATGLEKSGVSYLWAEGKKKHKALAPKFQEAVEGRGFVTSDWVDQQQILRHGGVKGFLSHCGWNSVLESISAGVPILALPLMAEQHLNARFVVEVAGVALRAMPDGGTVRGFVTEKEIEGKVRQLMAGEEGDQARRKAAELSRAAQDAVRECGSSYRALDSLVAEINGRD